MNTPTSAPIRLPSWAWKRPEVQAALDGRDVGSLLKAAQQYTGVSQSRLAGAIGMLQGRISELVRGNRTVTALESFERIAVGLNMPDEVRIRLGLAPLHPVGLDHLGLRGRAEIVAVYPAQSLARPDIDGRARNADVITVLAVRGLGIIGLNDSLLRTRVQDRAVSISVLLLDPDCEAAARRAKEIGESYRSFGAGIRLSLERLADIDGNVAAYVYDVMPTWRVIGIDETLFVSTFGESHEGHTSPMYQIASSPHGALYRGFCRFMDELRSKSRRVL